ncbi:MAG: polysaccharide biosynthesis protein [Propionibacteriaceae bacterium]|nr:polysaccharide biosynthesis protein [Propionibacteriaceae bacterium]
MSRLSALSRGNQVFFRVSKSGWGQWFLDACSWAFAVFGAAILRYEFHLADLKIPAILLVVGVIVVVQFMGGMAAWLYQGRFTEGSLEEIKALGWIMGVLTVVFGVGCVLIGNSLGLPRSLMFLAAPLAVCAMLATRLVRRFVRERPQASLSTGGRRTLIFGAGGLGRIIVHRILMDSRSSYDPVGFLDDDAGKVNLAIRNVRVLGRLDDLAEVSQQTRASVLIVAIADATPALMARVMSMATPLEIDVKIVPTLDKSFGERTRVGQIRDIAIEDLIERQPVKLNIDTIASYLSGRRVLVTGAGGSIGQELCVQIRKFGPQSLVMLDNDETHLQDTEMALWGTGLLMRPEIVLADIRDKENLARLFDQWKPEVVFHAAAYKHVPMLQRYPREAWETNVVGTLNVLECSADVGTEVFVNISTDKAANPTTALGHSKRLAERLTSWMGEQTSKPYCSVRFGNVIGSRGSMVPLVRQMIDRGLTITITHEEATRYFMTIPEACQLVVQAGGLGSSGDVMILDMGNPVRVMDIINRLVEISGKDCEIEIIGMREGEKIHEVLVSSEEESELTDIADRTTRAYVPPISPENLDFEQWIETVVEAREPRGATAKR